MPTIRLLFYALLFYVGSSIAILCSQLDWYFMPAIRLLYYAGNHIAILCLPVDCYLMLAIRLLFCAAVEHLSFSFSWSAAARAQFPSGIVFFGGDCCVVESWVVDRMHDMECDRSLLNINNIFNGPTTDLCENEDEYYKNEPILLLSCFWIFCILCYCDNDWCTIGAISALETIDYWQKHY